MPNTPSQNSLALSMVRLLQGWSQRELAAASGVPGNLLSDYEKGRKPLSRERLEMLASTMGRTPEFIEHVFAFLRQSRVSAPVAGRPSDAQNWRIELVVSDVAALAAELTRLALTRVTTAARAEQERQEAEALWARLKTTKPPERRRLVEAVERFRSWALCELVCRESVDAARDSADRALDLADLALYIAELTPGDEAWRSRVQGYAWAHVGNARRVKGNLPAADEAFRRARRLWQDEGGTDPVVLNEAFVFGLEASLRRDQRRLSEAVELLDKALLVDRGQLRSHLLLSKAKNFEELQDYESAVSVLVQVMPLIQGDPQLLFATRMNLAVNLSLLKQNKRVEELLPELRRLAVALGNGLDIVRLRWLESRVALGLGDRAQAFLALSQVREEFAAKEIAFDSALVSLELAILHLEEGQTAEVKLIARQMLWIFRAQGVHREALVALRLFCEAAEKDAVTVELAKDVLDYFRQAQYDPNIPFNSKA